MTTRLKRKYQQFDTEYGTSKNTISLVMIWRKENNLENCPRMAGIEPRYRPRTPICGILDMTSGKVDVDACTRV